VKKNPHLISYGYSGKITEYFLGLLYGSLESREISPAEKLPSHMLHLQYGPLLSRLHQRRQSNNTYKCEICMFYNSIPVGVTVTSSKAELGRFRKETECCCTCDSSGLDPTTQKVLYFKVKKKMKALDSCKNRVERQEEQQQKEAGYTLASARAPRWLLRLDC